MARLQILELPSGLDDARAPFVLVVDETMPDRVIIGFDGSRPVDRWGVLAEQIGARGVVVTSETVEIPANELLPSESFELVGDQAARVSTAEAKLKAFAEEHYRLDSERMGAITDALGLDRLQDWDEITEAARRMVRPAADGETTSPRMPARGVYRDDGAEYVSGHLFGAPGYRDPVRCCRCTVDRVGWAQDPAEPSCDVVLHMRGRD